MSKLPPLTLDAQFTLVTESGAFELYGYVFDGSVSPTIALMKGESSSQVRPLVRVQSRCDTSEIFGSKFCDCDEQLKMAMQRVQAENCGLIIHLDQEARGNGLRAKLRIYQLMQTQGLTSGEACKALSYPIDARTYEQAAAILYALGITRLRLLTNNPRKLEGLRSFGLDVEQENLRVAPNEHDRAYLLDKQRTHGHDLGL